MGVSCLMTSSSGFCARSVAITTRSLVNRFWRNSGIGEFLPAMDWGPGPSGNTKDIGNLAAKKGLGRNDGHLVVKSSIYRIIQQTYKGTLASHGKSHSSRYLGRHGHRGPALYPADGAPSVV